MRESRIKAAKMAMIAGALLLAPACGDDGDEAANDAAANRLDSNAMLAEPANDASAMEAAVNAAEPAPVGNSGEQGNESGNVLGETSGGDTGGNIVESNVSGM
jgi:hypothetical protein